MRAHVTRAAERFDRRCFTVDEVLRMQDAGMFAEDENFELIEGDIVPLPPKTHAHELLKSALGIAIARALQSDLWVGFASTIYLTPTTFVEPDLVVYSRGLKLEAIKGADIRLAIEVAQSGLAYDRNVKSRLYARCGVQEYWVVDAANRRTFVHSEPSGEFWGLSRDVGGGDVLTHPALPDLGLRLTDY